MVSTRPGSSTEVGTEGDDSFGGCGQRKPPSASLLLAQAVDRVSDGVAMALGNRLQTLEEQVAEAQVQDLTPWMESGESGTGGMDPGKGGVETPSSVPDRLRAADLFWWPLSPSAATSSTAVGSTDEDVVDQADLEASRPDIAEPAPPVAHVAPARAPGQKCKSGSLPAGGVTLARARALSQMAMEDLSRPAEARVDASYVQKLREECQAANSRIQANISSVAKISGACRVLEAQHVDVEDAKSRVRHARNIRSADISVCRRRLELLQDLDWVGAAASADKEAATVTSARSSETPETSQKNLMEALEVEQEALLLMRRELDLQEEDLSQAAEQLQELHGCLKKEMAQRRAALRQDSSSAAKRGSDVTSGTSAMSAPGYMSVGDSWKFWAKRVKAAQVDAQHLCKKASSTIQYTDLECAKAQRSTQDCLAQCSSEQRELRRRFDTQLKDVEFAMSCAEWTLNKPENRSKARSQSEATQVQRSNVLLHELSTTQKNLRCLSRQCKRDLQVLEACRNVTTANVAARPSSAPGTPGAGAGTLKSLKRSRSAVDTRKFRKDRSESQGPPGALWEELQHLTVEQQQMTKGLRECEYGVDRCAAWASVLSNLEDRVTDVLLRRPLARRSLSALTEDDRPTTSRLRRVSKETSGKEPYLRRCFVVNFRRLMELQKVFAIIHELIKSTAIAALTLVLAGNVWQLGYSVLFVAILFVMYGFHAAHYDTMDIRRCLSDYHHLVDLLEDDHGVCGGRSIDNPNRLLKALTLARTGRRRRAVLIILLFGLLCSGMWSMVAYSWTMELTEGVWSIGDEFYATLLLVGTLMLLFHTVFEWLYWRETQCVMPWWNRQLKEPWDPARHGIPCAARKPEQREEFGLPSMWFTCGSAYSDLSLWIQHAKGQWRGKKVNKVFPEEMALFSLHASGACQLRRTLQHAKLYSVQRCSFLTREGDANALPKGSDPEELQINFEQKETQIHVLNRPIRSGTKGADRLDLGSTLLEHAANIEKSLPNSAHVFSWASNLHKAGRWLGHSSGRRPPVPRSVSSMREVVAGAEDAKLGLVPQFAGGEVLVKDVSKGGWAETAGIRAGARLLQVNGVAVPGMADADFKAALKQRPLQIRYEQKVLEVVLEDPAEKLGCSFSGAPPANAVVAKVSPGSFAERSLIQVGYELVAVNGDALKDLTDATFRDRLKARPVRLRYQVPEDAAAAQQVQAQANAATTIQAHARGHQARKSTAAKAASANKFEIVLEDAEVKLGCGFAGIPPEPVMVGKVSPGSFAERSKIQTGQLLVALNGTQMKELNAETFKQALKGRPVRLSFEIPLAEEKAQVIDKVETQESAATAIQALARGHAARKDTGLEAASESARRFEVTLSDAETKLGCGFAGLPPEPVLVAKVSEGSFAATHKIQTGHLLVALNGVETKDLTPDTFQPDSHSLRLEIPQAEEKAKAIDKVETQENAATAIQALARGRAARKGTGLEAASESARRHGFMRLSLCLLSFAEICTRHKIQTGHLLVALNGVETKDLTPDTFKQSLKARPVSLRLEIPQAEACHR
eukprot:s3135_g8.t2